MSPDDVGYVPLGTANSASGITGLLPAFILSSADISQLKTSGVLSKAHLVLDYAKVAQMPINGLAVSQKLITDNPDTLRKLLRAIVKGLMYARAYKQGAAARRDLHLRPVAPSRSRCYRQRLEA